MLGINAEEALVLVILALALIGPKALPRYARQLGSLVRTVRTAWESQSDRIAQELGDDVPWRNFSLSDYDPRRIIADALAEPAGPGTDPGPASSSAPTDHS